MITVNEMNFQAQSMKFVGRWFNAYPNVCINNGELNIQNRNQDLTPFINDHMVIAEMVGLVIRREGVHFPVGETISLVKTMLRDREVPDNTFCYDESRIRVVRDLIVNEYEYLKDEADFREYN